MPSARPASEPQLFSEVAGPRDPEFARVLRTADPGPALDGPLTFLPPSAAAPADWLRAWNTWREGTLTAVLAPVLLEVVALAVRGCVREILAADRALDAALAPDDARSRSVAAGRRLLARLAVSRGERSLSRFQQWAAAGEMPAHFPTIYAVQHALFHLPLRLLVPAYAYCEWSSAMAARPTNGGTAPGFAQESDRLCRLAQDLLWSLSPNHAVPTFPAASGDR